ncbi:MAG: hypothetical protein JXR56_08395 [Candidatus Cloacimonetes bacterium]|nr:hypothetical protein [Candidatus Cloacimonadota bacterium]
MGLENYLYHRPHILTTVPNNFPHQFREFSLGKYRLLVGEDGDVTCFHGSEMEVFLVGNWYDYRNPTYDNEVLVSNAAEGHDFASFIKNTFPYCGTFTVFCLINKELYIFNDLHGLNSVFYSYSGNDFTVTSDPALFTLFTELEQTDNEWYEEAINSERGKKWGICPGTNTGFKGIYRLLPNSYLNVNAGIENRFYPDEPVQPYSSGKAVTKIAQMLSGYLKAASNRRKLSLALTAGWDSRILFAASLELDDVFYYTLLHPYAAIQDSSTAEELCRITGRNHTILEGKGNNNLKEIEQVLSKSVYMPMASDMYILLNTYYQQLENFLDVCGITGEVLRGSHNRAVHVNEIRTASDLLGFPESRYMNEEIHSWLDKNKLFCRNFNIEYLDLLYSDLYYSVVKAKNYRTFAHFVDTMIPYNSRELLSITNGVNKKSKYPYNPSLMKEVINTFNPELLKVPFNPQKSRYLKLLVKSKLYYPAIAFKDITR